jgi:hypothetical protein
MLSFAIAIGHVAVTTTGDNLLSCWQQQLQAGTDFRSKIEASLRSSDAVVICFSKRLVRKIGFVQRELRWALDAANERPAGVRFVFPVKLEPCEIPSDFETWQYQQSRGRVGYQDLAEALVSHAHDLSAATPLRSREPLRPNRRLHPTAARHR